MPFIMELPNYRLPSVKTTVMLAWDKAKDFITKAFTIIFAATVVIWFLQTFDIRFNVVADQSQSLLAGLGGAGALTPAGLATGVHPRRSSPDLSPRRVSSRPSRCFWARPRPRHCRPCFRRSCLCVPGLYAAVPALCGSHRRCQERVGRALCRGRIRVSGCRCLDRGVCRAFGGHIAGVGLGAR